MRNDLPWVEPKSPWNRLGSTALALVIAGVGVAGAVRIVRAQDGSQSEKETVIVQATPKADSDSAASQKDRAELDALLKQREDLDKKIAALSKKMGVPNRVRVYRVEPGDRYVYRAGPDARALSPEDRKAVQEAMRQAQEAMRMAQEAMRQAQRALPEAERNMHFFVVPPVPAIPAVPPVPKIDGGKGYYFLYNGKEMSGKDWEAWQQGWQKWQQDFQAQWEKQRPEFEKNWAQWGREFEKNWAQWGHDFELKMKQDKSGADLDKSGDTKDEDDADAPEAKKEAPKSDDKAAPEPSSPNSKPSSTSHTGTTPRIPVEPNSDDAI